MNASLTYPLRQLAIALLATCALVFSQAHAGGNYSSEKQQSGNIVETAAAAGQFETLLAAAKAAGLVETLSGQGPLTVFAPTDEAFAALPEGTVDSLLKPENRDQLRAILTYHVVPASAMAADVVKMDKVTTANGQDLSIRVDGDSVMIGEARVVKANVKASNGVIHVIDKVLIPAT